MRENFADCDQKRDEALIVFPVIQFTS